MIIAQAKKLLVLVLIVLISGCVARLPERPEMSPDSIPLLSNNAGRVYVYFGSFYMKSAFGISASDIGDVDGQIYINDQLVGHINEDAIILDLTPATYQLHWEMFLGEGNVAKNRTSMLISVQ